MTTILDDFSRNTDRVRSSGEGAPYTLGPIYSNILNTFTPSGWMRGISDELGRRLSWAIRNGRTVVVSPTQLVCNPELDPCLRKGGLLTEALDRGTMSPVRSSNCTSFEHLLEILNENRSSALLGCDQARLLSRARELDQLVRRSDPLSVTAEVEFEAVAKFRTEMAWLFVEWLQRVLPVDDGTKRQLRDSYQRQIEGRRHVDGTWWVSQANAVSGLKPHAALLTEIGRWIHDLSLCARLGLDLVGDSLLIKLDRPQTGSRESGSGRRSVSRDGDVAATEPGDILRFIADKYGLPAGSGELARQIHVHFRVYVPYAPDVIGGGGFHVEGFLDSDTDAWWRGPFCHITNDSEEVCKLDRAGHSACTLYVNEAAKRVFGRFQDGADPVDVPLLSLNRQQRRLLGMILDAQSGRADLGYSAIAIRVFGQTAGISDESIQSLKRSLNRVLKNLLDVFVQPVRGDRCYIWERVNYLWVRNAHSRSLLYP